MHLKTQFRTLGNPLGISIGINKGAVPRHIDSPVAPSFVGSVIARSILLVGTLDKDQHVMNDTRISWPDLDRLNPVILVQVGFDHDVLIRHRAGRFDLYGLGEFEFGIWLSDQPAICENSRSW